jgi:hypothetical protein
LSIKKRVVAISSALALATGLTVATATQAEAAAPPVDVTNASVTCNDIIGKIKFSVPLTLAGGSPNQITLTVKSTDCIDNTHGVYDANTNPGGVSLKQFVAKGILNATDNGCLSLQGLSSGTSGTVTGTFATNAGTPKITSTGALKPNQQTLTINQTYGGTYNDGGITTRASDSNGWGSTYGFFYIGPADAPLPDTADPVVAGAYSNGGGANLRFNGTTAQSTGTILTQCIGLGVKGIQFGIGGFTS